MVAALADYLQVPPWAPGVPFWAALALVAGALLGELVRRAFGVPRIVGYSVVGGVIGFAGFGAGNLQGTARLVVDLALALLLFELGSRVRLRWLRDNPALLLTSAAEALGSFVAIYFALRAFAQPVNLALVCATLGSCASGAVIARVAGELKAAGQVSERMIVLTSLNTLFARAGATSWSARLAASGPGRRLGARRLAAAVGLCRLGAAWRRCWRALVGWVARRLDLRARKRRAAAAGPDRAWRS